MRNLSVAALASVCLGGCAEGGGGEFTISGRMAGPAAAPRALAGPRTITHVMAVDPETASPRRSIARVGADGSFELAVEAGHPYVIVFIDNTAVGADMVVAIFRANTLDSISPQLAGHLVLGDVSYDPSTGAATAGISYDDLLASLGLDPSTAELLGAIDDLSLRYANPDIDGDGVLDLDQDRRYALDIHVRAAMVAAGGARYTVADLTDRFLPETATPRFDLTSLYALYPASFDPTDYVSMAFPSGLTHGAVFSATLASGAPAPAASSFSGLGFGDTRAWGPDYNFERDPALELPGSGGVPATLAYTLGARGTTLTFTNVVTRTRASLTERGTLVPFIKLVTDGTKLTAIDYAWKKRATATTWAPATAEDIAVVVSSNGGYISVHRVPSWSNEVGVQIPAEPTGTIAWPHDATAPADICGLAVSFDDKLGLRHFAGGVDPDPGVTCAR